MSVDNPGNFFDADKFPKDESENSNLPVKILGNSLFKKSIDVLNITRAICDLMVDDKDGTEAANLMMHNAVTMTVKVKSTFSIDNVYSLAMENAVIIKINATELLVQLWACEAIHGLEKKYVTVLKEEMSVFKAIFIKWIKTFDKENDLPDEWHLFNNPDSF